MKRFMMIIMMMALVVGIKIPAQARRINYEIKPDQYLVNKMYEDFEEAGCINTEVTYIGSKQYLIWTTHPEKQVTVKAIYSAGIDDFVEATCWSSETGDLLAKYNWLTGTEYTEEGKWLEEE